MADTRLTDRTAAVDPTGGFLHIVISGVSYKITYENLVSLLPTNIWLKSSYANKNSAFTHAFDADTMICVVLIKRTLSNPTVKCGTSPGADDIFKQRTIDPTGEYYTITSFKSFKNSGTLYFTVSGGTINLNIFYINSIM